MTLQLIDSLPTQVWFTRNVRYIWYVARKFWVKMKGKENRNEKQKEKKKEKK